MGRRFQGSEPPWQSGHEVWVGQLWAVCDRPERVVRVTSIDPGLGLVDTEGDGGIITAPIPLFVLCHERVDQQGPHAS